jgi:CheY-like chemotaxis protein
MKTRSYNLKTILVTEDVENEGVLLKHAFEKAGVKAPLEFVRDGQEAIDYLGGTAQYSDRAKYPFPGLLLLDLKLPARSGFEVLEWVRARAGLKRLPVVVFSASARAEDVTRAYELGASSYLVKPMDVAELGEMGKLLEEYWYGFNFGGECEDENCFERVGAETEDKNLYSGNSAAA